MQSADSRDLQSADSTAGPWGCSKAVEKADTMVDLLVAATVDGMVGRTVAHSVA